MTIYRDNLVQCLGELAKGHRHTWDKDGTVIAKDGVYNIRGCVVHRDQCIDGSAVTSHCVAHISGYGRDRVETSKRLSYLRSGSKVTFGDPSVVCAVT